MDADAFRGDRYLRASAYHLLGWAIVGLGLTLPLYTPAVGQAWPTLWQWLLRGALMAAGVSWSFVSERRAMKIAGPPSMPARSGAVRVVAVVLVVAAVGTVGLLAQATQYIAALWLLAAAVVLTALGWGRVPLYSACAALLALGALVALTLAALERGTQTPLSVVWVWNGLLATVVIPCALLVNRHYLWRFESD